jgi:rod shape determining protein RodA
MNERNSYIASGADKSLIWLWFILSAIGVMSIFSATYHDGDNVLQGFLSLKTDYSRQSLFFVISGIAGIFILLTDSNFTPISKELLPSSNLDLLFKYSRQMFVRFL